MHFIDKINAVIGRVVSWFTVLLVIITVIDVALRYFFKAGNVAVQELEWHLFAALILLGAAYTLKEDGHVRVDLLYSNFSQRAKAAVDLVGGIFLLLPFSVLMVWTSLPFVIRAFELSEGSPDPGGLPLRFIVKAVIPLGFALLALQGLSSIVGNLKLLVGRGEHSTQKEEIQE